MAIYKCKMCGGELEVKEAQKTAICDYCGTEQTIPSASEEEIQSLFNRANVLRRKGEFDKAAEIYDRIIEKSPGDAEGYWGALLCEYGIEYVEDQKSFKQVPTCHRTSHLSILDERYYRMALACADVVQKRIYEEQAREIDAIQKSILAISKLEEPYDIFICYKESDSEGKKTVDSSLADDIYYELNEEGYKVFFAPVTLKSKLGSEYEPIIYAALSSSKIMVALGTKPEYFNAVWVKNEWSRFLKMMQGDSSKRLMPCYRDMDAYELPEEFAHLQALNMSSIGFARELVKAVNGIIPPRAKEQPIADMQASGAAVTAAVNGLSEIEAQIKRAFIFLRDGELDKANEYCDKVLDLVPEYALAYLCKAMAAQGVSDRKLLSDNMDKLSDDKNFLKAVRFADGELRDELLKLVNDHEERTEQIQKENAYNEACKKLDNAYTEKDLEEAEKLFSEISGYRDADRLEEKCRIEWDKRVKTANEAYEKWLVINTPIDDLKLERAQKTVADTPDIIDNLEKIKKLYADYVKLQEEYDQVNHELINLEAQRKSMGLFTSKVKKAAMDNLISAVTTEYFKKKNASDDAEEEYSKLKNKLKSEYDIDAGYRYLENDYDGLIDGIIGDCNENLAVAEKTVKEQGELKLTKDKYMSEKDTVKQILTDKYIIAVMLTEFEKGKTVMQISEALTVIMNTPELIALANKTPALFYYFPESYKKNIEVANIKVRVRGSSKINFGNYKGKPISWVRLCEDKTKAVYISELVLTTMKHREHWDYNKKYVWTSSLVYKWLQGEFKNSFDQYQKSVISELTILDSAQASKYFSSNSARSAANKPGIMITGGWWLKDGATGNDMVSYVTKTGEIVKFGSDPGTTLGVRPVITINLS